MTNDQKYNMYVHRLGLQKDCAMRAQLLLISSSANGDCEMKTMRFHKTVFFWLFAVIFL